eukprot:3195665-Prymnesium_polylepis.1
MKERDVCARAYLSGSLGRAGGGRGRARLHARQSRRSARRSTMNSCASSPSSSMARRDVTSSRPCRLQSTPAGASTSSTPASWSARCSTSRHSRLREWSCSAVSVPASVPGR